MATIPQADEKPTRFGNPARFLDVTAWKTLEDHVFECRTLLCPEAEGGFSAHAIRLPGVVSQGESVDEALKNISEAFQGAISVYLEQGDEIPWTDEEIDRPKGWIERWILVHV